MPIDRTQLDRDFEAILDDLPEFLTYPATDGGSYRCNRVAMSRADMDTLSRETIAATNIVLSVRTAAFGVAPKMDEYLIHDGRARLILFADTSPDGVDTRLYCGDEYAR